jgi:hypothetical protein
MLKVCWHLERGWVRRTLNCSPVQLFVPGFLFFIFYFYFQKLDTRYSNSELPFPQKGTGEALFKLRSLSAAGTRRKRSDDVGSEREAESQHQAFGLVSDPNEKLNRSIRHSRIELVSYGSTVA